MKKEVKNRLDKLSELSDWMLEDVFIDITDNGISVNRWKFISQFSKELIEKEELTHSEIKKQISKLEIKNGLRSESKLLVFLIAKGKLDFVWISWLKVCGVRKEVLDLCK